MSNSYRLTIALNALNFLGPNLYSNIPAVLSEMVANAWDADATQVCITIGIENDRIIIEDNGLGMLFEDMNDKYLRVGYRKREQNLQNRTPSGRHFMGRKGIGMLAIFSFAKIMEIQSSKNGNKSGCVVDWADVKQEMENNSHIYYPSPLEPQKIDIDKGTRITLNGLYKEKLSQTIVSLRKMLARRFTVIDNQHDFDVRFNGTSISSADKPYLNQVEFIWYMGDESVEHANRCKNALRVVKLKNEIIVDGRTHKISGWVGTVVKPKNISDDQNNTIALFAHSKLIQEDILADFQESQAYAEYIIGNIEADFLDSDDEIDIITPDRQRINQNDPRYKAVKIFIKDEILRKISRNWSLWRLERDIEEALKYPDISSWYENLKKTNKTKAARLLGKIEGLKIASQEKLELYRICIRSFNKLKDKKGISSMDEDVFLNLVRPNPPKSTPRQTSPAPSVPIPIVKQLPLSTSSEQTSSTEKPVSPPARPSSSKSSPVLSPHSSTTSTTSTTTDDDKSKTTSLPNQATKKTVPTSSHISQATKETAPSQDIEKAFKPTSPPKKEVETAFRKIRDLIQGSTIEKRFKETALYDLEEAQKAYSREGYKGCVIMFGAVLEGVMLATLRKPEVLAELRNPQYSRLIKLKDGIGHSKYADNIDLGDAIANQLTFEQYRQLIQNLIPEIESLKIEGIQAFRNAIHPWKAIKEPNIYGSYDLERAMNHLTALKILVKQILTWKLK
ncbi:ATP-binding protein [Anaerolineales bacterium HSG24]|nr:ATP-binding protein [Anaerolineales bacterium HSG24]